MGASGKKRVCGLIHCYTGDGKGKTTAAVGLALRAVGSGKKVLFSQFLKDGSSSELAVMRKLPGVLCRNMDKPQGFYWTLNEEQKQLLQTETRKYFAAVREEAEREAVDLLVLDEFTAAYRLELIDRQEAVTYLRCKPESLELVLTGRDAPEEITALCDYVTECRKQKHPYDRGIPARRGIEY